MYANTAAGGSNTSLKVEPVNKSQLRKSDSGSLRSQSGSNIRSGSYDNIPGPNTSQAIFALEPNPTAYEIINFQQPGPVRGSDTRKMSQALARVRTRAKVADTVNGNTGQFGSLYFSDFFLIFPIHQCEVRPGCTRRPTPASGVPHPGHPTTGCHKNIWLCFFVTKQWQIFLGQPVDYHIRSGHESTLIR